jgi:hypothetical protein
MTSQGTVLNTLTTRAFVASRMTSIPADLPSARFTLFITTLFWKSTPSSTRSISVPGIASKTASPKLMASLTEPALAPSPMASSNAHFVALGVTRPEHDLMPAFRPHRALSSTNRARSNDRNFHGNSSCSASMRDCSVFSVLLLAWRCAVAF